jgi:hypothetical protein
MSEDLEGKVRRALRPIDPGEDFTRRVMDRVSNTPPRAAHPRRRVTWIPAAAIAASLLMMVVVIYEWQQSRKEAGLAARAQVIEALRVTNDKLDLAYRLVNEPPKPAPDGDPGA